MSALLDIIAIIIYYGFISILIITVLYIIFTYITFLYNVCSYNEVYSFTSFKRFKEEFYNYYFDLSEGRDYDIIFRNTDIEGCSVIKLYDDSKGFAILGKTYLCEPEVYLTSTLIMFSERGMLFNPIDYFKYRHWYYNLYYNTKSYHKGYIKDLWR